MFFNHWLYNHHELQLQGFKEIYVLIEFNVLIFLELSANGWHNAHILEQSRHKGV